jgi:hypothetical protein
LDPKAKEKNGSSSSAGSGISVHFPWMSRERDKAEKETENSGSVTTPIQVSPPPSAIQTYAKSQEEFNTSCIKKEGHRYPGGSG